jgi:hypothetical protein
MIQLYNIDETTHVFRKIAIFQVIKNIYTYKGEMINIYFKDNTDNTDNDPND